MTAAAECWGGGGDAAPEQHAATRCSCRARRMNVGGGSRFLRGAPTLGSSIRSWSQGRGLDLGFGPCESAGASWNRLRKEGEADRRAEHSVLEGGRSEARERQ